MKAELTKSADLRTTLAAAGYDPATEATLARLLDVLQETKWSLSKVATDIGISSTRLSRILSGKYGADIGTSIGMVQEFLRRYGENQLVEPEHFVEIKAWQLVRDAAQFASMYHRVVNVYGPTQAGKTRAALEYQARTRAAGSDHVLYLRMSACASCQSFASDLCRALGMEPRRRLYDMLTAIKARLSPRHLLIVDEIHEIALGNGHVGLRIVEMLREILDLTHCGLVLIGTNVWRSVLTSTHRTAVRKDWVGWLEQLDRRGDPVQIPATLSHEDTLAICAAYGLPEPDKDTLAVVRQILRDRGLGRLCKTLQAAATTARAAGKTFAWCHFLAVHGQLVQISGGIR